MLSFAITMMRCCFIDIHFIASYYADDASGIIHFFAHGFHFDIGDVMNIHDAHSNAHASVLFCLTSLLYRLSVCFKNAARVPHECYGTNTAARVKSSLRIL